MSSKRFVWSTKDNVLQLTFYRRYESRKASWQLQHSTVVMWHK